MPTHTEDEIKTKIANGSIFAISVDTAIFDRYGCNLKFASLRKLDQFKDDHIRVLLSEIVEGEVTSHIARDATETQRALKKALSAMLSDGGSRQSRALRQPPSKSQRNRGQKQNANLASSSMLLGRRSCPQRTPPMSRQKS